MSKDTRRSPGNEAEVVAKIAKFSDKYRPVAEKLHELIMSSVHNLHPRLWYGMPGYARTKDSAVICFFREDKYVTFGLNENANFSRTGDEPNQLMECAWFLTTIDEATEKRLAEILDKALS